MIPQEILTDNTYKHIKMINLKLTHSLTLHSGMIDHFHVYICFDFLYIVLAASYFLDGLEDVLSRSLPGSQHSCIHSNCPPFCAATNKLLGILNDARPSCANCRLLFIIGSLRFTVKTIRRISKCIGCK